MFWLFIVLLLLAFYTSFPEIIIFLKRTLNIFFCNLYKYGSFETSKWKWWDKILTQYTKKTEL